MDDVRKHLQEAAEAHQPDRERILARIQQGMAGSADADRARSYHRRRRASWLRASAAGLAGVALLGLGGLAVAAGVQHRTSQRNTAVIGAPTGEAAGATPTSHASATKPAARNPGGLGAPSPRHSATPTAEGPIAARGDVNAHSTAYWEQNDLMVDVAQPLTTLIVELRVAQSAGVQSTGSWQTAPPDDFTVTVTQTDGFLVYRWTLKPGRTVPAAQQLFAAQFNHSPGRRDASNDAFLVETIMGGRAVAVRGGFLSGG